MKNKYNILPELRKLPSLNLSYRRWIVALLNGFFTLARVFQRNKSGVEMQYQTITRTDCSQLRIIKMTPPVVSRPMPCLLYYHGGAFALTYAASHLKMCQRYAKQAGCCIIFVDYRLMPAHPFPAGQEDCHLALQWVVDNADSQGIDKEKIAVGGDSAGGALAASVCQMSQDRGTANLCGQLLIYPVTDKDGKTDSAQTFSDTPIWTSTSNKRMWDTYLSKVSSNRVPDYASPIHREDLSGMPTAYVETAEFDPLHDEGIDYAKRLIDVGIDVIINETRGTVHGYDALAKTAVGDDAMVQRITFLQAAFTAY